MTVEEKGGIYSVSSLAGCSFGLDGLESMKKALGVEQAATRLAF